MFETNLSKVRELFYKDTGLNDFSINLRGLIKYALITYQKRYLSGGRRAGQKKMTYESDNKENKLHLHVVSPYRVPDLNCLEIESRNANLPFLLENLRGNLDAEFSGFEINKLREDKGKEIVEKRERNYSQLGSMRVFLLADPNKPGLINRGILGKPKERKRRIPKDGFEKLSLEKIEITPDLIELLSNADFLKIRNSSYERGDANKRLIHETSDLFNRGRKWFWHYEIRAANNGGIPGYIFPALNALFSNIENKFSAMAFSRMKITNPGEYG